MYVRGFRRNLGADALYDIISSGQIDVSRAFFLDEENMLEGISIYISSYDLDTGWCTMMFDKPITEVLANLLLKQNDIFIYE